MPDTNLITLPVTQTSRGVGRPRNLLDDMRPWLDRAVRTMAPAIAVYRAQANGGNEGLLPGSAPRTYFEMIAAETLPDWWLVAHAEAAYAFVSDQGYDDCPSHPESEAWLAISFHLEKILLTAPAVTLIDVIARVRWIKSEMANHDPTGWFGPVIDRLVHDLTDMKAGTPIRDDLQPEIDGLRREVVAEREHSQALWEALQRTIEQRDAALVKVRGRIQ